MLRPDDLASLLATPRETVQLDFKERLNWDDPAAKFGVCRDIAGFANRQGGHIVIGVAQHDMTFTPNGMAADDPLPDPTDLNRVLLEKFAPGISCEAAYVDVAGRRYGRDRDTRFRPIPSRLFAGSWRHGTSYLAPGGRLCAN